MTLESCRTILEKNLDRQEVSFATDLHYGHLRLELFNELLAAIVFLNANETNEKERYRPSGLIWEILYHVVRDLYVIINPLDPVQMGSARTIMDKLYWSANCFQYRKHLEYDPMVVPERSATPTGNPE